LGQIAGRLRLPKSTVTYSYIVNKWKRTGLVERRRGGAGRHRVSILDEDVALTEVVRNDPFATAVQARNLTGFPGCLKAAQ
jgi:DNA-binding MarR family transcriptional regulator